MFNPRRYINHSTCQQGEAGLGYTRAGNSYKLYLLTSRYSGLVPSVADPPRPRAFLTSGPGGATAGWGRTRSSGILESTIKIQSMERFLTPGPFATRIPATPERYRPPPLISEKGLLLAGVTLSLEPVLKAHTLSHASLFSLSFSICTLKPDSRPFH